MAFCRYWWSITGSVAKTGGSVATSLTKHWNVWSCSQLRKIRATEFFLCFCLLLLCLKQNSNWNATNITYLIPAMHEPLQNRPTHQDSFFNSPYYVQHDIVPLNPVYFTSTTPLIPKIKLSCDNYSCGRWSVVSFSIFDLCFSRSLCNIARMETKLLGTLGCRKKSAPNTRCLVE